MADEVDQELWAAVVAAQQQLARARAEFHRHAQSRPEILAGALRGSSWERGAALSFLETLPDDVPELLDVLIDNAMAPGWALAARRAIAAGRPEAISPLIKKASAERSLNADAEDCRRLAELLEHLGESDCLADLLQAAGRQGDPEYLEIVEDFRSAETSSDRRARP
ncbi:hypothetical protein BJ973_004622 [Actinoplanes tereljensis]|uniref:Uncharacterized protein n=1 Tax=Paractinoplanes tereljensis TaxID=571912 RepID=A0A919NRZ8_9ACTN|nr:hypothetical protein [Actinoplanes tereljensis]GIF24010.1 hypothetical protein Ate02nite_67400 [Actinoplanes tereljensis]